MSAELIRVIRVMIAVPLAFFSILGLFVGNFVFSYLNQSVHTPEDQQLTFYNYLLPLLLTIGFIFYFTREQILSQAYKTNRKFNFIIAFIILISACWALPWQIRHIQWLFDRKIYFITEWTPVITAILFTLGSVIIQIINIKRTFSH